MRLEWDQDWIEKGKYFYRKGFADHLADAFQYAYNLCFHHSYDPLIDTYAEPHSTEWYDRKERAMEERQIRQVESPMGVLDLLDL
jgi:hypothetical protein